MGQQEKGALFRALKAAGVQFEQHYRNYTEEALQASYDELKAAGVEVDPLEKHAEVPPRTAQREDRPAINLPIAAADPNEMAGQRQNTNLDADGQMVPIRQDEQGRIWFQEEVRKPAAPKPRGRRILRRQDGAVEQMTVVQGDYTETFEVAGNGPKQATEIKITLPSYQVGIYADRRFPFKIVTYNGTQGFLLADVIAYYGGIDLVPDEIKRVYISNVLCYDIRTTVRAIQTEYRRLQLQGKA